MHQGNALTFTTKAIVATIPPVRIKLKTKFGDMKIINATLSDVPEIFRLYSVASAYQKTKKNVVVWPQFDRKLVEIEVAEKRQFRLLINNTVACIWAVTFTDAAIWSERNSDAAIYIHRIAVDSRFRGQNLIATVLEWAKNYAKENNKRFIRMDTVGDNSKLIAHYTKAGFDFLGLFTLKNTSELPAHYQEAPVSLFQIDLTT